MKEDNKIYLTGITGNLGAYMACVLLKREDTVLYVPVRSRSNHKEHLIKRVVKSLAAFGLREGEVSLFIRTKKLNIINADITSKEFKSQNTEVPKINELWHFASSLKYMPKDKDQIFLANIDGVKNVIDLFDAKRQPGSRLFYISTAYILGKSLDYLPDGPLEYTHEMVFNNEYEHSKLIAEKLILDAVANKGMEALIFRPSIVVGDVCNGKLTNYNGYYLGVRALANFKDFLMKTNRTNEVIRFSISKTSGLNLVPIDLLVKRMLEISNKPVPSGTFFNITNSSITSCRKAITSLSRILGINLIVVEPEEFNANPKTKFEKIIDYGFNYIMPYMHRDIQFSTKNSDAILQEELHYKFTHDKLDQLALVYLN